MKGSRREPDADNDRDEGSDEGGEDTEGPWGRRAKAWRRLGDDIDPTLDWATLDYLSSSRTLTRAFKCRG